MKLNKPNTMTAEALSKLDIEGINVQAPYGELVGEMERNAVIFIWGTKGAGKSTFSLGFADALAEHGRVEYIPAEEHFGKTLVDRVKRLNATHPNLNFTRWKSIQSLKDTLRKTGASFCVLDSITVIDSNDKATVNLAQWCRENGIGFIMVAHATKDGKYKGNTSIAHECDIEIEVTSEGHAVAEKNRYRTLTSIDVPFVAKDRSISRKNPSSAAGRATITVDGLTESADLDAEGGITDPKALPKLRKEYDDSIQSELDSIIQDFVLDGWDMEEPLSVHDTFTGELSEGQHYEIKIALGRENPSQASLKQQLITLLDQAEESGEGYYSSNDVHFADQVLRFVDGEMSVEEEEEFLQEHKLDLEGEMDGINPEDLLNMAIEGLSWVKRENPVKVPFSMTLKEIDKLHKFRSWRRINSLMGSKLPCYTPKHSGESDTAHFSIRYTADYRRKLYTIELLLDGRLEHQVCTKGANGGFKQSWKKIVDKYGDVEVMIYAQDHAKKVLGAKEYKKQEREFAKSQKKSEKDCPPESKKKKSAKKSSGKKGKPVTAPKEKKVDYNILEGTADYFNIPAGTKIVPLSKVEVRKKNPEKSIANARWFMLEASEGIRDKRDPVTAYKQGDKYIVVDGNATTTVAKRAGWKELPITLVDAPSEPKKKTTSKKKPKKSQSKASTKAKKQTKKSRPANDNDEGIDIEAAKRSQSKIDAFLESILS